MRNDDHLERIPHERPICGQCSQYGNCTWFHPHGFIFYEEDDGTKHYAMPPLDKTIEEGWEHRRAGLCFHRYIGSHSPINRFMSRKTAKTTIREGPGLDED